MEYIIGICDDEPLQLKVSGIYIKELSAREQKPVVLKGFRNSKQLYSFLQKNRLDILFLDIDLANESGMDIAKNLTDNFPELAIIFLSCHNDFIKEAFELNVFGYITKPINEQLIERTLHKAFTQVIGIKTIAADKSLIITEENIKKKIPTNDINYIERVLTKSIIHTKNRIYQVYESITSLCERLDNSFLRINQSTVIRCDDILKIEGNTLYLKNSLSFNIGRTYKKTICDMFYK